MVSFYNTLGSLDKSTWDVTRETGLSNETLNNWIKNGWLEKKIYIEFNQRIMKLLKIM